MPGKTRKGPQIINAVSWDPELWEAVACEDPHVRMWAVQYHQLLLKGIPKAHPDMTFVLRSLNSALKDYNRKLKEQVMEENAQLDEMKLSKELRDLYLVQREMRQQGHQRHHSLPYRENSQRLPLLGLLPLTPSVTP